jgi:hypothetical protein
MRLLPLTALLVALIAPLQAGAAEPPFEAVAAVHLARARETRAFTERTFQYLAGGSSCPRAVFVSYARSERESTIADQWYQVSQIWADLALAPPAEPLMRCWAIRGFTFLDRLWDTSQPSGGFFPGADLPGEYFNVEEKYADDNSLAGLVWMEAAQRAPDSLERELMLGRARATADFLMHSGIWDETFGGGFWWNTTLGATVEGKPAQSNGLAAEFFLALYAMTGEPSYREWGLKTLAWLDQKLYDPRMQLYRWNVGFEDRQARQGEVVADRYFNYDQGILVEANLLAYRLLGRDRRYFERAWSLGRRLDPVFWDQALGGYDLEAGIPQVFPAYSAWLTQSLLTLHEQDGDWYWLERAAANVDALNRGAWDEASGGYYHRYYVCRDTFAPGCADGAAQAVDVEKHSVDQAWMQRVQALLASALPRTTPRAPVPRPVPPAQTPR